MKFLEKSQQLLYSTLYFEYKSIVMDSKCIFQRLGSTKQKGCNFLTNLIRANGRAARHNVADLEAALICIALKMGQ